jgi:hypothetical protein
MTNKTTTTENKLIVILDTIGRTILGQEAPSTKGNLNIKNPVILHIVPADNTGKMSVQLLPLFFREFLGDKSADVVFTYDSSRVTTTDIDALDFRLQSQYAQMFNPQNAFVTADAAANQPPTEPTERVVNLFDE